MYQTSQESLSSISGRGSIKENRHDDVAKAASDADFCEKLFKEYGI